MGLGVEALDPAVPPEREEAFNVGLDFGADNPEVGAGALPGRHLWPAVPGLHLRQRLDATYAHRAAGA